MRRALIVAVVAAGLAAAPAWADKDKGKGKEKGKAKQHEVVRGDDDRDDDQEHAGARVRERDVFGAREREAVHGWWDQAYGRDNCPPGLAKKHNGCLPPGQAKKRYVVGQALPRTVVLQPLPPILLDRFGPPPRGYQYGLVDGDVVKLAVGTRLVVDAINALTR